MQPDPFRNVLILTGPTGSGKTALALELAERLDAEIVSMDSMTVYRGMDIGTAKPNGAERERVRHHLIDELDPWQSCTVAWWLERAKACCQDIDGRGKRALFVGGTPLYLKVLLRGLFPGPGEDPPLRRRLAEEAEQLGRPALHARLAAIDPVAAARLHPNDVRRVIRALEVWELTGRPLSDWQTQWRAASALAFPNQVLWLNMPRPELYARIDARVQQMFAAGLVDEVRALLRLDQPPSREARQALGYKEVFAHLEGQTSLEETIALVQAHSRQYAKRQLTWFRHLPECRAVSRELTFALWGRTIGR